jgi:heat-inducible transcriptional repressor
MAERELARDEQAMILHQFHQSARQLEDWVSLAASVLAHSMHTIGLVTQPRLAEVRLKQLQLVEVGEAHALLVVVTSDTQVHQATLDLPAPASQEALTRLSARLNRDLEGRSAAELALPTPPDADPVSTLEGVVRAAVTELLARESRTAVEQPVVEGVRDLLRQPEFEHADRMLDTLEAVDEHRLRTAIPSGAVDATGDVAIVIGDENADGPYRDMSFVLTRYGAAGGPSGMLGILGPTRLPYGDAVSHVRYVRDVLTELLRQYYGEA